SGFLRSSSAVDPAVLNQEPPESGVRQNTQRWFASAVAGDARVSFARKNVPGTQAPNDSIAIAIDDSVWPEIFGRLNPEPSRNASRASIPKGERLRSDQASSTNSNRANQHVTKAKPETGTATNILMNRPENREAQKYDFLCRMSSRKLQKFVKS